MMELPLYRAPSEGFDFAIDVANKILCSKSGADDFSFFDIDLGQYFPELSV